MGNCSFGGAAVAVQRVAVTVPGAVPVMMAAVRVVGMAVRIASVVVVITIGKITARSHQKKNEKD